MQYPLLTPPSQYVGVDTSDLLTTQVDYRENLLTVPADKIAF